MRWAKGVDPVEQVPARLEEVELVGGDERAPAQLVSGDELDDAAVGLRLRVQGQIDPDQLGVDGQLLRPAGEDSLDGRLAGRHADEVERRPGRRTQLVTGPEGTGLRRRFGRADVGGSEVM